MRPVPGVPIHLAVIEFPHGHTPLTGALSTELASLQAAELIRVRDVAVIERAPGGDVTVRSWAELHAVGQLGDLADLGPGPDALLTHDDTDRLAALVEPGRTASVVVWESAWADALVGMARECGGQVVADGIVGADVVPGGHAILTTPPRGTDR